MCEVVSVRQYLLAILFSVVVSTQFYVMNNVTLKIYDDLEMPVMRRAIRVMNKYHNSSDVSFSSIHQLTSPSRRNMILKIDYSVPSLSIESRSIIFKRSMKTHSSVDQSDRFGRDWAGLVFFNELPSMYHRVPEFYGASRTYNFILMEVLGSPPISLETYYQLGSSVHNQQVAVEMTNKFMTILGTMHAASHQKQDRWHHILTAISKHVEPWQQRQLWHLATVRKAVNYTLGQLNAAETPELREEIAGVMTRSYAPGPFSAVAHSDLCPDNVLFRDSVAHMFDFEWAENRSAFIDAVALRIGMPGCYYSGVAPTKVVDEAEVLYRRELAKTIPEANDDVLYNAAYMDGCAYWVLRVFEIIRPILRGDGESSSVKYGIEKSMKIVIMRLDLFLEINKRHNLLPHINNMVVMTRQKLVEMWAEKAVALSVYSVFAL